MQLPSHAVALSCSRHTMEALNFIGQARITGRGNELFLLLILLELDMPQRDGFYCLEEIAQQSTFLQEQLTTFLVSCSLSPVEILKTHRCAIAAYRDKAFREMKMKAILG